MEAYDFVQDNGIGCTPNLHNTEERNGEKLVLSPEALFRWDLTNPHGRRSERLLEEANAELRVTVSRIC
jgi:hypothetical protein